MVDRWLSRAIDKALKKYTSIDVRDYESLLHLAGEYRLAELEVEGEDWLAGQTLKKAGLREEGLNVLAIKRRDGKFLGSPHGETVVNGEDTLIVYGRTTAIHALDRRRKDRLAEKKHAAAKRVQERVEKKESEEPSE